uniref:Cytoplasmic tRNA 2-thiolation protein 1 n=1 Tax=Oryza meridionalis TaxID=40149 RepID=A0A0E0C487_9ORYZ
MCRRKAPCEGHQVLLRRDDVGTAKKAQLQLVHCSFIGEISLNLRLWKFDIRSERSGNDKGRRRRLRLRRARSSYLRRAPHHSGGHEARAEWRRRRVPFLLSSASCKILCPSQLPMDPAVDGPRQPPARAGSRLCTRCGERKAALKRPKTLEQICRECFYIVFEDEIHQTIVENNLFKPGDRVAIGASGGKDSTVLAYVLSELNHRHKYCLDLFLLSVDEGITGYRDDSLETVKRNEIQYGLPLKIISYKDLYGWTMDDIVKAIGLKNNCTFCGVFRRQALDRGAALLKVDKIVTGHNADDIAETVLLNILRGDIARLSRCTFITTGEDGPIPRCKPFKYTYEKEILDYFSTECIYSPNAYRGFAREFIKDLERMRPRAILDIIKSGENFRISTTTRMPEQGTCERCGYISSQKLCKACVLLDGLNRGLPKLGVGRTKGVAGGDSDCEQQAKRPERSRSSLQGKHGNIDF